MEINNSLQNLYAAKQKQQAYNDYKIKAKNEEGAEGLFNTADINGDGKVTNADATAVKKEITDLTSIKKTPNLLDVNADEKVDLNDLLSFETNVDIDADGTVDENEKAFLEEQKNSLIKQLQNQKDTVEYDINGDGKVDLNDATTFLQLTEKRGNVINSEDTADKYLASMQKTFNKKFFNFSGGNTINLNDLATTEQRLQLAQEVVNGSSKLNYLSEKYLDNADIDKNGVIDDADINIFASAIKSLQQQLGVDNESLSSIQKEYEAKLLAYDAAKEAEIAAKKEYSKATKENKAAAKDAYNAAKVATSEAKKAYTEAKKEYDAVKSYFTKTTKLENSENNEILNNYTAEVKSNTKELKVAEKTQTTLQKAFDKAEKDLNNAKTKLETLEKQVPNATGNKLKSIENQIKILKETTIPNLETAKANALNDLDTAKGVTETKTQELNNVKAINYSLETSDEVLLNALDNLTNEEKLLIKEQNIDITETFEDGSPKYVLAKGKSDGKFHLYQFDAPGSDWATTLIRNAKGYSSSSLAIISNGNGRINFKNSSSTDVENSIVVPKKVETEVTTTKEVTEIDDLQLEIVMDELVNIYNQLSEDLKATTSNKYDSVNIPQSTENEVFAEVQKEVISSYYNDEITKDEIASTIADKVIEKGLKGGAELKAVIQGDYSFGYQNYLNTTNDKQVQTQEEYANGKAAEHLKINNLIEHLVEVLETTKTTTIETITETEIDLVSEISNRKYITTSPLSFDINGDGVKTSENKVKFDIDGDGKLDVINDSADAVLVFDADKDGVAGESGLEVFGNITDLDGDGQKDGFVNGFDALKSLALKEGLIDGNDMTLDSNDLSKLQEKYSLGMKMGYNGETKSLKDMGITSINLSSTNETQTNYNFDGKGNELMTQEGATFEVNGKTQAYADIWHRKYDTLD